MLSLHEVATLMLVKNAPDQTELDQVDLDALLEHQYVSLERPASGHRRPCITATGSSVLQAIARIR
ncbi:hypothetical protein RA280_40815 [Cupriavidus sp. CV2]|uniref:hypothetical protein n=1 Tax=Cupriavidus ulmosensis TaxID=3065913 RepID=UPI00296AF056|nr:hypothetical protein [Cupriavidus sp. CV2]MDW3687966.1 hypothetical protein [Cupriavidus sp. CV2]